MRLRREEGQAHDWGSRGQGEAKASPRRLPLVDLSQHLISVLLETVDVVPPVRDDLAHQRIALKPPTRRPLQHLCGDGRSTSGSRFDRLIGTYDLDF